MRAKMVRGYCAALFSLACSFDTSGVGPENADGDGVVPDGGESMLELVGCPIVISDTQLGKQASRSFAVHNAGSSSVRVTSVSLVDVVGGTFSIHIKSSLPTVLQPKEVIEVRVRLTPTDSEADSASVAVLTDEEDGTKLSCLVEGHPLECNPTDTSDETCDGIDDDCNGAVDEDYVPHACVVGLCETLTSCDEGKEVCPVSPISELCNGEDDDCDGDIDEDFPLGDACDNGELGICLQTGVFICGGGIAICDAPAGTPGTESCNDLDDDCDGLLDADEGCVDGDSDGYCASGLVVVPGNAICGLGGDDCNDSDDSIHPGADELLTCGNCIDNDCDGLNDDGCPRWTPLGTGGDGLPSPRHEHSLVWTGSEALIWGGTGPGSSATNTGSRYDPTTGSWTTMSSVALAPRGVQATIWTGSEMIVWGGWIGIFSLFNDGAKYNPSSDTWTSMSPSPLSGRYTHGVWTGSEAIFWGGYVFAEQTNTGGRYDPIGDTWELTKNDSTTPSPRGYVTLTWTGSEMIAWGGSGNVLNTDSHFNTGGRYNPTDDSWIATNTVGAPTPRGAHVAEWTGSETIVWGGVGPDPADTSPPFSLIFLNTGGRYSPSTDSWTATETSGAPSARQMVFYGRAWAGSQFSVWGGAGSTTTDTGGIYDPIADSWAAMDTTNAPSAREPYRMVWTESQLMVFGGSSAPGFLGEAALGDGGLYCP